MTMPADNPPTVVAITGASGCILGLELVKALLKLDQPVELMITSHSFPVMSDELSLQLPQGAEQGHAVLDFLKLNRAQYGAQLTCYGNKQLGAAPASGTHLTRGMAVIPCSMSTLGKLAAGISDNLATRAADVTLKERRPLIIVPRESPFNRIHLENMLRLDAAGAIILAPMLSFYQEAFQSIDGQIAYTIGKVLDHLGLHGHGLFPRWEG